jgi:ABC-type Fe3+/spermidine/putrescine transport system ATPase subunit
LEERGQEMIEKWIVAFRIDFHETDIYTILGASGSLKTTINHV